MDNIQQDLMPGAMLLHGTYRIERMLGQGGFGITYLATDLNLDRLVAIKEFFPKNYCDRDTSTSHVTFSSQYAGGFVNKLKAKFLKEARNIAKFDHPGIIKIHAAFEENNTAYYVMDYIEGESLSEMVRRRGPLTESQARGYMEKIGKALEYIHAKKINHLDIKPANIMVRQSDNNPILIDFGLSKQYDSSGQQTSTTPTGISHGYAPMEQYNDGGVREFSPQTDLYSLAATLYFILSGVTPPQATRLVEYELTFPGSIPTSFIAPISKAMSPRRGSRHESVGEFVRQISGAASSDSTVPAPRQPAVRKAQPQPSPKPAPKHVPEPANGMKRNLFIGIGVAAVVAAATFLFLFWRGSSNGTIASVDSDSIAMAAAEITPTTVTDFEWTSPLGKASYTGEVKIDSTTGNKIPHGAGEAIITAGKYKGNVYTGAFVDGNMEGEAVYKLTNGDEFRGTYKNNEYSQGRYTFKDNGDYFEGSFKNGSPDKGSWYNSNGKKI